MTKEEAWQKYQQEIMPTRRNYVYPLEGAFYKTWSRAWDDAVESCAKAQEAKEKRNDGNQRPRRNSADVGRCR